jgi:hypothetical protein
METAIGPPTGKWEAEITPHPEPRRNTEWGEGTSKQTVHIWRVGVSFGDDETV